MIERVLNLDAKIYKAINDLSPSGPETLASEHGALVDENGLIRKIVDEFCQNEPEDTRRRIEAEYFGAGPIEITLEDSEVTEIILNGSDSIWIEKQGRLQRLPDQFLSELNFRNFIARMSRDAGIQANLDCPYADGKWRDCRVHLIIPPASGDQPVVTLRRHPKTAWSLDTFAARSDSGSGPASSVRQLVRSRSNFLIIGCTGSGKTSLLNACLSEIPEDERTVIIEDTQELNVPNSASTRLITRRDLNGFLRDIDQSELLKQALRMRPDRIVMGEIRGNEAKDLLMAFATGHTGCMGTLHADSARQALLRLEMLIQLGAPQWSLHAVRTLILLSIQDIVVMSKSASGKRQIEGIYKITSLEDIGFLLEKK